MATWTGYTRSTKGEYDAIYECYCTTCKGENLNTKALFYCKDCSQLFCDPCKKYHNKFTREHRVLGIDDVAKWGDVKPLRSSLMCDDHPGKELEMFCDDHDHVCCSICIGIKHRVCKEVKPVSEVAKGIQKNSRFKSFVTKAAKTQSRLKHLYDKQEKNIILLQKARGEITSLLKDIRNHFNQIVDRLEQKSTAEMDKLISMLRQKITSSKTRFSDVHDKIQKYLLDIQNLEKLCDEHIFQSYKKCCEHMTCAKQLLSSKPDVDYKLEFTPDAKMKEYLSSLESLGTFHVTPSGLVDTLINKEPTKSLTFSDHVYSVVNKKTHNVKTDADIGTCYLTGMCQLPDENTAVVDFRNTKVKLLSKSVYCVLDELKMPLCPQDICYTKAGDLAVTVFGWGDRKEIQFINAGYGKLSHTRTVKLDHDCLGIAYYNDQLFVGSNTALYVYSLSGKKIKKLYEDISGGVTVNRFSLSVGGSIIYITKWDKNLLLTLDISRKQLSTITDSELQGPQGVCVADNSSVFVSGQNSHTILQVDKKGRRKITTLATQDDGVNLPQTLCYDRKTHTLLVGQVNDNLLALTLE